MKNFWRELKKPIYVLAPMAGITDSAFRQISKSFGAAVVYSEMVSSTAIFYNSEKTLELVKFNKKERPIVIQLFGAKPEHFAKAAEFISKKIKPDGLDVNFGCPVKKVARQGAGAVLMNNLKLARRIVAAVLANTNLPVSVKCRSRVGETTVLDFLKIMRNLPLSAIMIHGRSLAQGHSGAVDWQIIKQARKYFSGVILANGGVKDKQSAAELLRFSGADGLGIGQGALGRPWVFREVKSEKLKVKSKDDIFKIMLHHVELVNKLKGQPGIIEMRKHLCWYVRGLDNASELRDKLVRVKSLKEIKDILK